MGDHHAWAVWAVGPTSTSTTVHLKFSWTYFFCIWQRINSTFKKRWGAGALPCIWMMQRVENKESRFRWRFSVSMVKLCRFKTTIWAWSALLLASVVFVHASLLTGSISLVFQGNRLTWAVRTLFLRCGLQHHMRIVFHSNWNELRLHYRDSGWFFFSKQRQGVTCFSGCKMLNAGEIEDCSMKHF